MAETFEFASSPVNPTSVGELTRCSVNALALVESYSNPPHINQTSDDRSTWVM